MVCDSNNNGEIKKNLEEGERGSFLRTFLNLHQLQVIASAGP